MCITLLLGVTSLCLKNSYHNNSNTTITTPITTFTTKSNLYLFVDTKSLFLLLVSYVFLAPKQIWICCSAFVRCIKKEELKYHLSKAKNSRDNFAAKSWNIRRPFFYDSNMVFYVRLKWDVLFLNEADSWTNENQNRQH